MRRVLVVANRTLCEQHLLDELHARRERGPVAFHLLVPASHPRGRWTGSEVEEAARARLADMLETLAAAGIGATGEIGDASPILAVDDLRLRQVRSGGTDEGFDEIIVSTLPVGLSRWMALNVVRRLQAHTGLPVTHVVAERESIGV